MTIYVTAIRDYFYQDKFDKLNDYNYFTKIGKTLHNCYTRNKTNWLFERNAIREIDLSYDSYFERLKEQQLAWEIDVNWDMLTLIEATALTMADKMCNDHICKYLNTSSVLLSNFSASL